MTEDARCLGREAFKCDLLLALPDDIQEHMLVVPARRCPWRECRRGGPVGSRSMGFMKVRERAVTHLRYDLTLPEK